MTTCLLCFAHCDDELLWGHPWLLDRSIERRVLICSNDADNPTRQSYRRGPEALAAVCQAVGISEYRTLPYFSEFYKLRTRGLGQGPTLKDWWGTATETLKQMADGCDFIATHNEWGEYSHADHHLVRRCVLSLPNRPPLKWTSAMVETSTWPIGAWRMFCDDYEKSVETSPAEFSKLKNEYVSRGCWTWSSEEPLNVQIIRERQ